MYYRFYYHTKLLRNEVFNAYRESYQHIADAHKIRVIRVPIKKMVVCNWIPKGRPAGALGIAPESFLPKGRPAEAL